MQKEEKEELFLARFIICPFGNAYPQTLEIFALKDNDTKSKKFYDLFRKRNLLCRLIR